MAVVSYTLEVVLLALEEGQMGWLEVNKVALNDYVLDAVLLERARVS